MCSHLSVKFECTSLNDMSQWKAKPFTMRRSLVIEGGWLAAPWPIDTKVVDDGEFVTLSMSDRCLAKALGMNMSERSPLANCSVFNFLASVRDAKVDELILAAKVENDPMADGSSGTSNAQPMPSRGRAAGFAIAKIPATISLKMASFVTPDGERVDEHTIRVVTTPKRRVSVTMEATPENFEWLLQAAQVEWDTGAKLEKKANIDEEFDLPELTGPCKYQKTENGKLKISCSYRQQGLWKKHQKAVNVNIHEDNSNLLAIIRRCEAEVLDFYHSHHEPTGAAPLQPGEGQPAPIQAGESEPAPLTG